MVTRLHFVGTNHFYCHFRYSLVLTKRYISILLDKDVKCKRGITDRSRRADRAGGIAPFQLFHVKHFFSQWAILSGNTGEFTLQTPKYFMKISIRMVFEIT